MFKPDLALKVAQGKKTQTRRMKHDGDTVMLWQGEVFAVKSAAGRIRYQVGQDHAVTPGRGKLSVWVRRGPCGEIGTFTTNTVALLQSAARFGWEQCRVKIIRIREEQVEDISEDDARAEGFTSKDEFLSVFYTINPHASPIDIVYALDLQRKFKQEATP